MLSQFSPCAVVAQLNYCVEQPLGFKRIGKVEMKMFLFI